MGHSAANVTRVDPPGGACCGARYRQTGIGLPDARETDLIELADGGEFELDIFPVKRCSQYFEHKTVVGKRDDDADQPTAGADR